jgi:hypothetical protein
LAGSGQRLTSNGDIDSKVVNPLETLVTAQNRKKVTV